MKKNRALFKEQLETQEKKSQERYNLLKKKSFHEKVALQQIIEKMSEQQKIIETELHQKQIEIEQSTGAKAGKRFSGTQKLTECASSIK